MIRVLIKTAIMVILSAVMAFAQESGIDSADDCMGCHKEYYAKWQKSAHRNSSAAQNPLYNAMLNWAIRDSDGKLEAMCKSCHEPARLHPVNAVQTRGIIDEGVTCDICHAVYPNENGELTTLNPTKAGVKLGPFKDPMSSEHTSEFNAGLGKSAFCLQCHNQMISKRNNLEICMTGPEWKETEYFEMNVDCQDCHMVSKSGKAAHLGKLRDNIHDHSFVGASEQVLRVAIDFGMDITSQEDSLLIKVKVRNRGGGHYVPTGTPLRSIILTVQALDEFKQVLWRNWRSNPIKEDSSAVFMRFLADANGNGPVPPWKATQVKFDHRLPSKKQVVLTYHISKKNVHAIEAFLDYRLAPLPLLNKLGVLDEKYTQARRFGHVYKAVGDVELQ